MRRFCRSDLFAAFGAEFRPYGITSLSKYKDNPQILYDDLYYDILTCV